MSDIKVKPSNLILFVVLLLSIFPIIHVGSFSMPVLYLLLPIIAMIFIFYNKNVTTDIFIKYFL